VGGEPGRNAYLTGDGLALEVVSTTLDATGMVVTFKVTDGNNTPLDIEGRFSKGTVSFMFALAWLDQGLTADGGPVPLKYQAYNTETLTSPITNVTGDVPWMDQGGTLTLLSWQDGLYSYKFGDTIPLTHVDRTHTLGMTATRLVDGVAHVANAVHDFIPQGGAVTVTRDVVSQQSCNNCHGSLKAHGGMIKDVRMCIMCHQPENVDLDTGTSLDFYNLVHKIHAGDKLPSVVAGTPFQVYGYMQELLDWSTLRYPQDEGRCDTCHGGTQGAVWKTTITRAACTTCHDTTSFVSPAPPGKVMHSAGPFAVDTVCVGCHQASSPLASVVTKHSPPAAPVLVLTITSVEGGTPGGNLAVNFTLTEDGTPRDLVANPLDYLAVTVAGPTADYAESFTEVIQGSGATGTLTAAGGSYHFLLAAGVPVSVVSGTYAVALEGYTTPGVTRFSANNPVSYFNVQGGTVAPRRQVVEAQRCNSCHQSLSAHGGIRTNPEYCVMCHNGELTNAGRVARVQGTTVTAKSLQFKVMIHKIHAGEFLSVQPYVLGSFPAPTPANPNGTPVDFGLTRFPNDLRNCEACHRPDTNNVPLTLDALPAREDVITCTDAPVTPSTYCTNRTVVSNHTLPTRAACMSCHDNAAAAVHAEVMSTATGESCAVCHAKGAVFGVDLMHRVP
jgi:OmcA/MtrC family decaheme c-type cytochrome